MRQAGGQGRHAARERAQALQARRALRRLAPRRRDALDARGLLALARRGELGFAPLELREHVGIFAPHRAGFVDRVLREEQHAEIETERDGDRTAHDAILSHFACFFAAFSRSSIDLKACSSRLR